MESRLDREASDLASLGNIFLIWRIGLAWSTSQHMQVSRSNTIASFNHMILIAGSRLSLAVHQDPHFRARHQLQTPSYRGSIAEPFYRGSLAEPRALAVNIEPVETSATLAYHQKHLLGTSSSSYGSSPDGVLVRTTGPELPLYGDSLDLDLPLRTSLHLRGRADVRPGRVDAVDLDRRGRELGERWAAVQQLEQRQRGEVEQIRAAFKPRSQVLPTVHEFTHDTLVTRFVGIPTSTSITSSFPAILNDSNNA